MPITEKNNQRLRVSSKQVETIEAEIDEMNNILKECHTLFSINVIHATKTQQKTIIL